MTEGTAACFGCGARFAPEVLEAVGDTVFCGACLGLLLRRSSANGRSGANGASLAEPPEAGASCFLCREPLGGSAFIELRGFAICASCARDLGGETAPAAEEPAAGEPATLPPSAAPPAVARAIETPGSGTEWCSRCGRAMPGPGSYHLVEGRPRCAACVDPRAPAPGPVGPAPLAAPAGDGLCDACSRLLPPGAPPGPHGFRLCAACLHSDPALALALARARHRRWLARTYHQLLDGDDDR